MRQLAAQLAVLAASASLVFAAAAPAGAHWSELAGYDVPDRRMADCLRVAGPGQLALLGRLSQRSMRFDTLGAARHGIAPASTTTLGWTAVCAAVAPAATFAGQPLLAAPVLRGVPAKNSGRLRVGTAGARPETLTAPKRWLAVGPAAVAQNARGAAVVAWRIHPRGPALARSALPRLVVAVRRSAGAPFGRPHVIETRVDESLPPIATIDAAGRATVAWLRAPRGDREPVAHVAAASAAGRFAAAQRLGDVFSMAPAFDLAVAPNGRALAVAESARGSRAWERRAGGRRFVRVPVPSLGEAEQVAVDLAADGAAVVAGGTNEFVSAFLRPPGAGARFGAQARLRPYPLEYDGGTWGVQLIPTSRWRKPEPPLDPRGGWLDAALAPDGQVVVSWAEPGDDESAGRAIAAHGTLAEGFGAAERLGSPCRTANAVRPLRIADGRLGVAWSDNATVSTIDGNDWGQRDGRVHLAAQADAPAPQPAPAPPGVTAEWVGATRIAPRDPLRIRVRCTNGPCDVRAVARLHAMPESMWSGSGSVPVSDSTTLAAGASAELLLRPTYGARFGEAGPTQPPIELTACAPDGPVAERTIFRPQLHGLPAGRRAR